MLLLALRARSIVTNCGIGVAVSTANAVHLSHRPLLMTAGCLRVDLTSDMVVAALLSVLACITLHSSRQLLLLRAN